MRDLGLEQAELARILLMFLNDLWSLLYSVNFAAIEKNMGLKEAVR